jgi:hypothetical protein
MHVFGGSPPDHQKGERVMTIYSIKLSEGKTRSAFEAFMSGEVFPAVDKRSTRAGRVTGLVLLRANGTSDEYLWLVYGSLNGGVAQVGKIEGFGAKVTPMYEFHESMSWFADKEGRDGAASHSGEASA